MKYSEQGPDGRSPLITLAAITYLCGHPYAIDGEVSPPLIVEDFTGDPMAAIAYVRAVISTREVIDHSLCPDCRAYDSGVRSSPDPLRASRIYDAQRAWALGARLCLVTIY